MINEKNTTTPIPEKVVIEDNGDMLIRIPAAVEPSDLQSYLRGLIPLCFTTASSRKMAALAG